VPWGSTVCKPVGEVRAACNDLRVPKLTGLGIDPDKLMHLAPTMAKDVLDGGRPANVLECEIAAEML
jgi:hypothetical protein